MFGWIDFEAVGEDALAFRTFFAKHILGFARDACQDSKGNKQGCYTEPALNRKR